MYGITKQIDADFEGAVERVRSALKNEGFGVLTEIDVKKTFREKLDADFRKYIILGACNPPLAHKALSAELEIGLLLPCNVIVYENDAGSSTVSAIDARSMLSVSDNEGLTGIADEVYSKLKRAMDAL